MSLMVVVTSLIDLFNARPVARALCRHVAPELMGVAKKFHDIITKEFSNLLRKVIATRILCKYDSEWRMIYLDNAKVKEAQTV